MANGVLEDLTDSNENVRTPDDIKLARVLKALLSAGDVTFYETEVRSPGIVQTGWHLIVDSSIVIDGEHANAVLQCNLGGNAQ